MGNTCSTESPSRWAASAAGVSIVVLGIFLGDVLQLGTVGRLVVIFVLLGVVSKVGGQLLN